MIELAPRTLKEMPYDQAWLYCLTLDYDGHKDWRLPTVDEYKRCVLSWHETRYKFLDSRYHVTPVRTKDD